jgi:FixJ family two-component response regulator
VSEKPLIACVDDDVSAREALEGFLKAFGFTADVFSSAEEFLKSDRLDETACLITDVHLRGMSGLQLQSSLAARASASRSLSSRHFPTTGFASGHWVPERFAFSISPSVRRIC